MSSVLCCLVAWVPAAANAQSRDAAATDALGHPAGDYARAAALLRDGKPGEATYWLYRGQLRFRVHLLAHPDLRPDGDPALFASLSESVGRPINEYAFGDVTELAATIDQVLAWHASNDDPFTPKLQYAAAHASVRAGLERLRAYILANRETIRAQRQTRGLPNRN